MQMTGSNLLPALTNILISAGRASDKTCAPSIILLSPLQLLAQRKASLLMAKGVCCAPSLCAISAILVASAVAADGAANVRVWLYSLVATDYGGHLLLPYYMDHYYKAGVQKQHIFMDLLHDPDEPSTGYAACQAYLIENGIAFRTINQSYTPALQDVSMMTALADLAIDAEDWVIVADTDELYTYGFEKLNEAIALMEMEGATFAQGEMLDHVSRDGTLTQLVASSDGGNLWTQFPLVCPVVSKIAEGLPAKITLHKGYLRVGAGHHHIVEPSLAKAYFSDECRGPACEAVMKKYKQRTTVDLFNMTPYYRFRSKYQHQMMHPRTLVQWKAQPWSRWTQVHHFKWHSALVINLSKRAMRDSGDCMLGVNEDSCTPKFQFWKEVARQYAALKSINAFNISELGCKEGVDTLWNW